MSGGCPAREAVIAAIKGVLPDVTIIAADPGPTPLVIVTDDGASYRVEAGGMTRTFVDPPAHCEERARKVAVVAALALEPPVIETGAPRMIAPTIELARYEPPAEVAMQIEAGGVVDRAPRASGDPTCAGVDLRLAIGRSDFNLVIGGAVVAPMTLAVTGGRARVQRVPIDLALRGRLGTDGIAGVLELGPRFAIQRSEGVDVMQSTHTVRLEVGARGAARLEVWPWRRYGAYVLVQGEYVPRPSRFTLPDLGEVGEMPSLWVGASLGLAIRTH